MHITNLTCETNNKYVTVVLGYNEVRDLANGLFWLSKTDSDHIDYNKEDYIDITRKMAFLFDMVKHGMIQPHTAAKFVSNDDTKPANTLLTDKEIEDFHELLNIFCSSEYLPFMMKHGFETWYNKMVPKEKQSKTVQHCISLYHDQNKPKITP